MKTTIGLILTVSLALSPAWAANDFSGRDSKRSAKEEKSAKKVDAPKPVAKDAKREEMKKRLAELKEQLNGSEWEVQMAQGGKPMGKDAFTFQNGKVTCKTLLDNGYPATNYTLSEPEGADMATWETMQTGSKGQVVFIRGEWRDEVMRGVMSEQLEDGKSRDWTFASLTKVEVPKETKEKEEPKSEPSPVLTSEEAPAVAAFEPGTTDEVADKPV